jgi:hypothetical protein
MRFALGVACLALLVNGALAAARNQVRRLMTVQPLPSALDPNFEFRKFKIFNLGTQPARARGGKPPDAQTASSQELTARGTFKSKTTTTQEASLNFERSYRLFGAVTAYDQRERFGQYFDFFWRAKETADLSVRFEYKQERLRAFTQAQEIDYPRARGTKHSAFRVVGDEFHDDGKVLAWRCLLIRNGQIVAEKRSFLWD